MTPEEFLQQQAQNNASRLAQDALSSTRTDALILSSQQARIAKQQLSSTGFVVDFDGANNTIVETASGDRVPATPITSKGLGISAPVTLQRMRGGVAFVNARS